MILLFVFASVFLCGETVPLTRWYRRHAQASRTLLKAAKASVTSKETEIKLTNVARASLEELLEDYRDFLRVRDCKIWQKESKEVRYVRKLGSQPHVNFESYREFVETRPAEVVANIAICLIHQTNYLLDQQIRRLEHDFLKDGGLRERMTRVRLQAREQQRKDQGKP
jgi:four helix bundle suffix protein